MELGRAPLELDEKFLAMDLSNRRDFLMSLSGQSFHLSTWKLKTTVWFASGSAHHVSAAMLQSAPVRKAMFQLGVQLVCHGDITPTSWGTTV